MIEPWKHCILTGPTWANLMWLSFKNIIELITMKKQKGLQFQALLKKKQNRKELPDYECKSFMD